MIIEEEEDFPKKSITRSKKRPIVDEDEEVVPGSMMIIEEEQVKSIAPVKTSPNKGPEADKAPASNLTKKAKLDDGKAANTKIVAASTQKPKVEEEKKSESKQVPAVVGPPKDLEKLKAPSNQAYDPIADAPFYSGQPVPFSFLSRALSEIEVQKGQKSKDIIKEIIANVFRSAILLSPSELPDLFYFFCIKLAPDYEGIETGIGHEILLKSVAKACGKSPT